MAKSKNRSGYDVYLDAPELGPIKKVGTLSRDTMQRDLPVSFEYDDTWLKSGQAFMLDPRLNLWKGEQYPAGAASSFGVFMDSAPDRWGRVLMERREAVLARHEKRKPRALMEVDFLLGVYDETRMGALRLCAEGDLEKTPPGSFLDATSSTAAPPVTSLQELAEISRKVERPGSEELPEYERWLAMLMAPGSSLGGARLKANFTGSDNSLWIAKFPAQEDRHDVGGWEQVLHELADRAKILVPEAHLVRLANENGYGIYCSKRFDRINHAGIAGRRMYASAMTLLERKDGQPGGSYLDLVQLIESHGVSGHINDQLQQLFRRVVFNVLTGNRDDHLRNHGFIREPNGWRLSPAFDMNPSLSKQWHALDFDGQDAEPSIELVMSTAEYYRLTSDQAAVILDEVNKAIAPWRDVARRKGLPSHEINRMSAVVQV